MRAKWATIIFLLLIYASPARSFEYYLHGIGKVIDTPLPPSLVLNTEELPVTYVVGPDSSGYIYGVEYKRLRHQRMKILKSLDGKKWEVLYTHNTEITSLYLWKDTLFFSDIKGRIFMWNEQTFEEVLRLDEGKYAIWWSWAGNEDFLLIGEYGKKSNSAKVYRTFDGRHFEVFFDIEDHYKIKDNGCHIHLVSIDPYDKIVYVGVGDNPPYRGLYIYKNGTWMFRNTNNHIINYVMNSGPLAVTYPDENRVFFYNDNFPQIIEYNKKKDELKPLATWFGEYYKAEMKFYDALRDPETGIHYVVSVDYHKEGMDYLWISLDGIVWRKISGGLINGTNTLYPIHIANGYLYMNNLRMKLFTREEALKLIYGKGSNFPVSGTLVENRLIIFPIHTKYPIAIVIKGKKFQNHLSTELNWKAINGTIEKKRDVLILSPSRPSSALELTGLKLENGWYTLGLCLKSSQPWGTQIRPVHVTVYTEKNVYGGLAQVSNEWRPFYYVFYMPTDGTITLSLLFNGTATYSIGCLFLSSNISTPKPNGKFLIGESYSKNVSLRIDDKTYYIGDLRPGETYVLHLKDLETIELLSGGAVDILITDKWEEKHGPIIANNQINNPESNSIFSVIYLLLISFILGGYALKQQMQ
ncbi:hypothetical protein EP1X_01860 [Thermococcus sp. EP1]|uniref:hypothetical protein n=1 Tax=Thermococcus sp. EP1 TaxID=1591054 RepID=UPI0006DA7012|nr:hypothetical protein [Thermococcus sp. EP1]KPU63956.1 hypothetical protein EP1X_01860 [Thermococcus sp. EP1]